jgi:hypothetical protein
VRKEQLYKCATPLKLISEPVCVTKNKEPPARQVMIKAYGRQ